MAARLKSSLRWLGGTIGLHTDFKNPPAGLRWRSNTVFICTTVGAGMSIDIFLYSLIVPIIPFLLEDRIKTPPEQLQSLTSSLLTAYAAASVIFSPVAGFIADWTVTRQAPFLLGLAALLLATVLLYLAQSVPLLVLARILQGVSGAVVWTVGLALSLDTVGPENLGKVTGTIFGFVSLASLMGPVVGGTVYEKFGYDGVFLISAAVLIIDFAMRLLVIEKRIAEKYYRYSPVLQDEDDQSNDVGHDQPRDQEQQTQGEETPLLGKQEDSYRIKPGNSKLLKTLPILSCFRNASLVTALVVAFAQALFLGVFDSTVPTEAKDLFGFDSLKAGLLFVPISVADLVLGPVAGWAVDRFGTKPVSVIAFGYLAPALISLRAVQPGGRNQIILYCALLALNGFGISATGAPAVVEAGAVVEKFHKANPGLFGDKGPYAQLYGFNSMLFSGGLAIGPILGGALREAVGYGNMNLVAGIISLLTAVTCLFFLGGPLRFPRKVEGTEDARD